ncbi:hypothetical protein AGRA3207_006359 [Actinomadura graeca]|uniref:SH3 domain-containing protein n=1 Tax=Actinomadura graeca TaxID=2750812 RepID=A0ABX8R1G6_9ACTN|nr:hypothetical protein [Actinomadura graeca]QXJ24940.1 hypothetical protein AGRA3207_006359 [Actinomadura graeca]
MRAAGTLGTGLIAAVVTGTVLGAGVSAGASQPPPKPRHDEQNITQPAEPAEPTPEAEEEGEGPGALEVGQEGAQAALNRLLDQDEQRARWCRGTVVVRRLNVRSAPWVDHNKVGHLRKGDHVVTNWRSIKRSGGYLWVKLHNGNWIADYKIGNGSGKWYVRYHNC